MKLQSPNPRTFRQFRLLILSYFKVLSALDFLVFWLMISITASDTKTRPPIFQQVLGKSLEQGMTMATVTARRGEAAGKTICPP